MYSNSCSRSRSLHKKWCRERVCAEVEQGLRAVAAIIATVMRGAFATAIFVTALAHLTTIAVHLHLVFIVAAGTIITLVAVASRCKAYKCDGAFKKLLERVRLLKVEAEQVAAGRGDGFIRVPVVAHSVTELITISVKAASETRSAAACALVVSAKRIFISTTHTSSSLRATA